MAIPRFAHAYTQIPQAVRDEQSARSLELQRQALVADEWSGYATNLREQAVGYADLGVEFADWYSLVSAYRVAVMELAHRDAPNDAADILFGMEELLAVSIPILGDAYLRAKEEQILSARGDAALREQLFEGSPDGCAILSRVPGEQPAFEIVTRNQAFLDAAGTEWVAVEGTRVDANHPLPFMEEDSLEQWLDALNGTPWKWTRKVGRNTYDCRVFALNRPGHLGLTMRDVTAEKRYLAAIRRHLDEIARSNRELDDFAYVASHDLKSPLSDVRNLATWLEEDAADLLPARSARHLTLLVARVGRMELLLDDLLVYSRVGRLEEQSVTFHLADVVDRAATAVSVPDDFHVELEGDCQFDGPPTPLETVLRNLLSNAIKHHDREEGSITIRSRPTRNGRVTIEVTDDGPGIPQEYAERIFRIFQTLRSRDEVESSGVGLAIVKKSVEHHGGTVRVCSEGRGTTFEFTWPVRWPPEEGELC